MPLIFNQKIFDDLEEGYKRWNDKLEKTFASRPERLERFSTVSDRDIKRIYSPADINGLEFMSEPRQCRPFTVSIGNSKLNRQYSSE